MKIFSFKSFFIIIYIVITAFMFSTFKSSILIWTSFLLNALTLFFITIYHLYYEKTYSPFISSYIVFNFLFLLAAPIAQINSFYEIENSKFVNFFPFKEELAIYVNLLIVFFNLVFICSYIFFKKKTLSIIKDPVKLKKQKNLPAIIFILLLISIVTFLFSFSFAKDELFNPNWLKPKDSSKSVVLLWKKFLFMVPLAGIVLCYQYHKKINKIRSNYINIIFFFVLFLILLLWFKNPLIEKRNALGPIYLSLVFLFSPVFFNSNLKMLSFLFFVMIILFPLSSIITHSNLTLLEIYNAPSLLMSHINVGIISDSFNTLNYDAFSNIMASIDFVNKSGFSYGYQLLGSLLFFFPRSIWVSKPLSSGQLVGDHLINDYGFNFANLSNPLISESFINFGVLGVFFTAITLSFFLNIMIRWLNSNQPLKKFMAFYFAMHLIFLLRGDFTNGFAYFIGPLLAIVYLPKYLEKFIIALTNSFKNES